MTAKAPSTAEELRQRPTADTTASTRPCTSTHTTAPHARKLCILAAGHDGNHRSGALYSWPRTDDEPPAGISRAAHADIEVEILTCADTGIAELILSDDTHRYEVVDKPAALAAIAAARAELDRAEALVVGYAA
ncbi:hypothetical protein PV392_08300 [Streptomyces sp. ME03-5709C]|nr:hypothetical protein [Streptomyces sp. ME03-5709C]